MISNIQPTVGERRLSALKALGALSTLCLSLSACLSPEPVGLGRAEPASVTVKYDLLHKPLPDMPLPNDLATRYDPSSATTRRINASMVAPTGLERHVRSKIDQLDGWGLLMPIAIPFTGEIDVSSILRHHRDPDYDPSDDVLYLMDVDPKSPEYGALKMLDLGQGNYPLPTENRDRYFDNDPRQDTLTIWLEEEDEDLNGNGLLDPGEDTDGDGILDRPNYLPKHQPLDQRPKADDPAARYDATMTFYERETDTLIAIPVVPLRPRTTYAVLITKRLKATDGSAVGSPFGSIQHSSQIDALAVLPELLKDKAFLSVQDISFAFTFTTQSTITDYSAVRDGIYGHGVQKHLAEEFPPVLKEIEKMKGGARYADANNPYILHGEEFEAALRILSTQLRDFEGGSQMLDELMESNRYVDYYMVGSFMAPQLSPWVDENGDPLRMNDQSWPPDLDRVAAPARAEQIYFTLVVPRKETSVRKDGKPAPIVIVGHGHTGNRFDAINLGPFFARHGLATLAIDNPGHGLGLKQEERDMAASLFDTFGLRPFTEAVFKDRARDLNYDGEIDSGADYWDFYMFHTRDNVRQTALDYMSLIKLFNSFDGERRWSFDLNGDGTNELAGDFDADGVIDVGLGSEFTMTGGSLGGIMSMLMGTVEPQIKAIAPIVGAGGLGLVSRRSINQNVRNAILARAMGPFYLVNYDADRGTYILEALLPDLTERPKKVYLGRFASVEKGDTLVVTNLTTQERRCGVIDERNPEDEYSRFGRVGLASDLDDLLKVELYRGNLIIGEDCALTEGAEPIETLKEFEESVSYWDRAHEAGSPLKALAEGLGLRRASSEFRRFAGLGPLVMDRADPAVMGRYMQMEPYTYPGTGETTGAHALITTGIGDLNVPVDGGATFARAAGILEWREPHPVFEVPENQVLIDHYVLECVEEFKRYVNKKDDTQGVLIDPDNFSNDRDYWAGEVPRLDPPLRAGWSREDHLGGSSALIHAYGSPLGKHGFDEPGKMTDNARKRCRDACDPEEEACPEACSDVEVFDVGNFHFNLIGDYLKHAGSQLEAKACHATFDCDDIPAPPAKRTDL